MQEDPDDEDGGFSLLQCLGGDRQEQRKERERRWLAQVRCPAPTAERATVFRPLRQWGEAFEPSTFAEPSPGEMRRRLAAERWAVRKVFDMAKQRVVDKVLAALLEAVSTLFQAVEVELGGDGDALARVFNACNGFALSYRFERSDPGALEKRMRLFRKVAVTQLYDSIEDWAEQTRQREGALEALGDIRENLAEGLHDVAKAEAATEVIADNPSLVERVLDDLAKQLCALIDAKEAEARKALRSNPTFQIAVGEVDEQMQVDLGQLARLALDVLNQRLALAIAFTKTALCQQVRLAAAEALVAERAVESLGEMSGVDAGSDRAAREQRTLRALEEHMEHAISLAEGQVTTAMELARGFVLSNLQDEESQLS